MRRLRQGPLAGLAWLLSVLYAVVLVVSVGCPTGEHDGLSHDGHAQHGDAHAGHLHAHHQDGASASSAHRSHADALPQSDGVAHTGLCTWSCQGNSTSDVPLTVVQSAPLWLADASVAVDLSSRSSFIRRAAPSRAPPVGA